VSLRNDMELALAPIRQVADRLTGFERTVIEDAIEVALGIADDEQDEQDRIAKGMLELLTELEDSEGEPRTKAPPLGAPASTTTEAAGHRATS
jgi:hypothetical protein